jgi:hypothetical protein
MTLRDLNLCAWKHRGYRALMGRMLDRVVGLGVVLAFVSAPSVASADPNGSAAGWRSPASGTMDLTVQATPDPDTGAALDSATATLGGAVVTESFADGTCSQSCPAIVVLAVDTHDALPAGELQGERTLVVTIEDVNGESKEILRRMITIDNRPHVSTPTVTIQIGSGSISPPSSPKPGPSKPGSGPACRSPRLSMQLVDRPLRFRRGVPVLKRGKAYRYAGTLTCRIDGRRRPAPRGTQVQVRNRLRGWTIAKPSITMRKAGDVVARFAYRSSRTVIFRVRGAGGEVVRVRIPIRVVRR